MLDLNAPQSQGVAPKVRWQDRCKPAGSYFARRQRRRAQAARLAAIAVEPVRRRLTRLDRAAEAIVAILSAGPMRPGLVAAEAARRARTTERTVRRAAARLGIVRTPGARAGPACLAVALWSLPARLPRAAPGRPVLEVELPERELPVRKRRRRIEPDAPGAV